MTVLSWTTAIPSTWGYFVRHRYLLMMLAGREVQERYKGSFLGMFWALLTPLLMLSVYVFVFSVVFQSRWGTAESTSRADFGLTLFAGLTAFNLFAETLNGSPRLILNNRNYVKRVVFPLEILPLASFLAKLVQAACCFAILVAALLFVKGYIHWTVVFLPLVLLPLAFLSIGCSYFLSSLGVFIRDAEHVIGFITTILMFLSAIFFPANAIPEGCRWFFAINPLVPMIEQVRTVILYGQSPDWTQWGVLTLISLLFVLMGLAWFTKSKRAFADVL